MAVDRIGATKSQDVCIQPDVTNLPPLMKSVYADCDERGQVYTMLLVDLYSQFNCFHCKMRVYLPNSAPALLEETSSHQLDRDTASEEGARARRVVGKGKL